MKTTAINKMKNNNINKELGMKNTGIKQQEVIGEIKYEPIIAGAGEEGEIKAGIINITSTYEIILLEEALEECAGMEEKLKAGDTIKIKVEDLIVGKEGLHYLRLKKRRAKKNKVSDTPKFEDKIKE